MVSKLALGFPLLSDADASRAIRPYGVWHDERGGIARPAVVIVGPGGDECFRWVARDFADRIAEDDVVAAVAALGLPPVRQAPPAAGTPEPGDTAMPVRALEPYFRGARFAAVAMGMRHPQVKADADAYVAEMDRYREAARTLRH
ncbi:hypothetical protein BH23ACT7_BH23ACT7_21510 [soil metagenome]|jgi:hypothetical protein